MAWLFLSAGGKMMMLLAKFYDHECVYRIIGTRHGFNVEVVFDVWKNGSGGTDVENERKTQDQ
jgi:hypothetical protein